MTHVLAMAICVIGLIHNIAVAGPYAPAAGQPGSTAIAHDDPAFKAWATQITATRGPVDINDPAGVKPTTGSASLATGPATLDVFDVISLGDGGIATASFANPITNGSGADFAVFENSFGNTFLELAFVEVSSNGSDFFRFDAVSLTQTTAQVATFNTLDPTDIHNLAGKYRVGFGTPFDLDELDGVSALLDVDAVTHVRVIDVVGRITSAPGNPGWSPSVDSLGNIINDPYSTPFSSGGFDLEAIGVIHMIPEPTTGVILLGSAAVGLIKQRQKRNTFGQCVSADTLDACRAGGRDGHDSHISHRKGEDR